MVGALLVGALGVSLGSVVGQGAVAGQPCGEGRVLEDAAGPLVCVHEDVPPPGVDVTEPVSTSELLDRPGAGKAAYAAAQDQGAVTAVASAATSPDVVCEGDGSSGYRVQPMYVVEASKANRYSALKSQFQLWAAGVDDVINRSAALSGGVRRVRFVTEAGGGGCVAKVLNVTVPDGSMTSFNATINAVRALGYDSPTRKYLMWTDASVLCGIATMYPYDTDGQANPNNGSYAQYSRIDSGCWGYGNGSTTNSVEAHELVHNLGAVQASAPYATSNGHCYDESDTMCYADGGGKTMQQICPTSNEYLLDCNLNDYFSTYPDPGSYLDTHWNSADNRFLIGGGDGTGGGSTGSPTTLGGTLAVNNPAVPGLPTQVSVTPALPSGRTLASVRWTSARSDCAFSAPTDVQSDVTCNASSATKTTVTATLADSSGATKVITAPLTFVTAATRAVRVTLGVDGQDAAPVTVCTGNLFPLTAQVVDVASGQPVKGLSVAFTKQLATATSPSSAGAKVTAAGGAAATTGTATAATTYGASTAATAIYAAGARTTLAATPQKCTVALGAEADTDEVWYGDSVTVRGAVTRILGGADHPVANVSVPVTVRTPAGKVTSLGTAKTLSDGTWSLVTKPTVSGTVSAAVVGTTGLVATTDEAGPVTVTLPATALTGAVDRTEVAWGQSVVVTGTLSRIAAATTPLGAKAVSVLVTAPGKAPVKVGSATTKADGTFVATVALKTSGDLAVSYAGAAGQPAATTAVDAVTASDWTPAATLTSPVTSVAAGTTVSLTGTVRRTYGATTEAAPALRVKIYATTGGTRTLVTSVTTTTAGAFTARVPVRATSTWQAEVSGQVGYGTAVSPSVAITAT